MKLDEIKELMRLFGKSKLDKMQIKQKDFEIQMEKGSENAIVEAAAPKSMVTTTHIQASTPAVAENTTPASEKKQIAGETITSPMVGTFYASPSPDSPHFVQVGDKVRKGDVLCILEAMKIMNELEAEYDCKILDILVNDGDPVEYDKPLFIVEKV
jgi:acetyl-CoA carboxylase biotin carboxyl carrier protein